MMLKLKKEIYQLCAEQVDHRIESLRQMLGDIQKSSNTETKSSMGDKYETSRAMMQLEKGKLQQQIEEVAKQKKVLDQINPEHEYSTVELGALIQADGFYFFLSISLGEVQLQSGKVYVISPVSPIGKILLGKTHGDKFEFMRKSLQIESVC